MVHHSALDRLCSLPTLNGSLVFQFDSLLHHFATTLDLVAVIFDESLRVISNLFNLFLKRAHQLLDFAAFVLGPVVREPIDLIL